MRAQVSTADNSPFFIAIQDGEERRSDEEEEERDEFDDEEVRTSLGRGEWHPYADHDCPPLVSQENADYDNNYFDNGEEDGDDGGGGGDDNEATYD
jgi:hypothetical protein